MKMDGRCHCGDLAYTVEVDPAKVAICHCSDCQEMSGAAYRVNAYVDAATFAMSGEPAIYERTATSGRKRVHAFCPRCGTNIYSTGTGAAAADMSLRTGTLRERHLLKPSRQGWCASALGWVGDLSGVPETDNG